VCALHSFPPCNSGTLFPRPPPQTALQLQPASRSLCLVWCLQSAHEVPFSTSSPRVTHTHILSHTHHTHAHLPHALLLSRSHPNSLSFPIACLVIYLRVPADLGYYAACLPTSSHSRLTPPTSFTVARVSQWRTSDPPTPFGDLTTHDELLHGRLSLDGHDLSVAFRRTRIMVKPSTRRMMTRSKKHGVTRSSTVTQVNATHINLLRQCRPHRLPCLYLCPFGIYLSERTLSDHRQRHDGRAGATLPHAYR
jgi:hypothetical protein